MTPEEYSQLKAYARIDGLYLALLWAISFACYIAGFSVAFLGFTSSMLAIYSPFFAAQRMRKFRNDARGGSLSFLRGAAYYMLMFFYASILFALLQYVYFAFIDNGMLLDQYAKIMSSAEAAGIIQSYGISMNDLNQGIAELQNSSPIMLAFNILTFNLFIGFLLSWPTALILRRKVTEKL
ncbi:MAG: DUF4199 domain-containing protein [Prevotella sp.]